MKKPILQFFRNAVLWLKRVPSSLEEITKTALRYSKKALIILQSRPATALTMLLLGADGTAVFNALEAIIEQFIKLFDNAGDNIEARKKVALDFAAAMAWHMDSRRNEPEDYIMVTQRVFDQNKDEFKVA